MFRFLGRSLMAGTTTSLGMYSGMKLFDHNIDKIVNLSQSTVNGQKVNMDIWKKIKNDEDHFPHIDETEASNNEPEINLKFNKKSDIIFYLPFIKIPYGSVDITVSDFEEIKFRKVDDIVLKDLIWDTDMQVVGGIVLASALFTGNAFVAIQSLNFLTNASLGLYVQSLSKTVGYTLLANGKDFPNDDS